MTLRPLVRKFRSEVAYRLRAAVLGGVALAGTLGLVYGGYSRVWPAIVAHPYFRLTSIHVRCDSSSLTPQAIAEKAGLYAGSSLWDVDVDVAEAALEEPGWVETATVSRQFPNRVTVEVKERRPVAAAPGPDGPYFVDASGIVYRPVGSREYPDVPYLTGWEIGSDETARISKLRTLLDLARAAEASGIRLSQVEVDRHGDYWVYPDGRRMPIRLGNALNPDQVFARLRSTLAKVPEGSTAVREIDASYPDRIVLRTWQGGYPTLVAELSGATRDDSALARVKKSKTGGTTDRG